MANEKKLIARASQRSNTAQGWAAANPVLYAGEIGIETDTGLVKHGDGETTWLQLGYWLGSDTIYQADSGIAISGTNVISALLLYEKLKIPNVRIRTAELYPISTSEPYKVYTDE